MNVIIPAILTLMMVFFAKPETEHCQTPTKITCSSEKVDEFTGTMMQWDAVGQAWKPLQTDIPENINLSSVWFGDSRVFMKSKSGLVHILQTDTRTWTTENPTEAYLQEPNDNENFIFGMYETENGTFASIMDKGLVFKEKNGNFWKPMPQPQFERYVHDITMDGKTGMIFLSCPSGIYTTRDMGQNWDHVYMNNQTGDLIFKNGICLAGTHGGIIHSEDLGKTWKKESFTTFDPLRFDDLTPFYQVLSVGNQMIALGGNEGVSSRIWKSVDTGKTWQKHDGDDYITPLQNLSNIVEFEGKLYCNHREGISSSTDGGKTWNLELKYSPKTNLNVSLQIHKVGNTMYVAELPNGC